MAHLSELTSAQRAVLEKKVIEPIYHRLTIHADDGDIELEDEIIEVAPVTAEKRIDLDDRMAEFTVGRLDIDLVNAGEQFDAAKAGGTFESHVAPTLTVVENADNQVDIPFFGTIPFGGDINDLVGLKFTLSDGKAVFQGTITAISTDTGQVYHRITFSPNMPLAYSFPIGSRFSMKELTGRSATLEYVLGDSGQTLVAGKFIVARPPAVEVGQATLELHDAFTLLLKDNLPANMAAVKEYQRVGSSTGTMTIGAVNVKWEKAVIGRWEIEILEVIDDTVDYLKFQVTRPDGTTKIGYSNAAFASDPQGFELFSSLYFTSDHWDGAYGASGGSVFEVGDKIVIDTYYRQQTGTHLADGLNEIISNALGSSYYDDSASNRLLANFKPQLPLYPGDAEIRREMTNMQAAALFCQHLSLTMQIEADGKLNFSLLQPVYQTTIPTLSGELEIIEVELRYRDPVKAVKVLYDYDWDAGEFRKDYTWPEGSREKPVELKLPFFTTETYAKFQANRYHLMWGQGLREVEFKALLNHGLGFDLSDRFLLTSLSPTLTARDVLLYRIEKNRERAEVRVRGFDVAHIWGNVAFYDVDNYDSGKEYV